MKTRYVLMGCLSRIVQKIRFIKLKFLGYSNIDNTAIIESKLNLDRVHPKGIHIGPGSLIASGVTILCHEHVKRDFENRENPLLADTYIGKNCFVGVGATILPGVIIGDEVIIGASTVVTKNIPSNSVAVGNPARIIKSGIRMDDRAILM